MNTEKFKVTGDFRGNGAGFDAFGIDESLSEKKLLSITKKNTKKISKLQDKLYADGRYAVLIVVQAMDAAGKDGVVKKVMSGVNPQGVDVYSFKQPSKKELAHDYLWRAVNVLPERGKIAIFNRSYYEDVLIGKVHKLYENYNLPDRCKAEDTIEKRYEQIRNFEDHLWENGIITVKFFLNVSKNEQRNRFLKRIENKNKNWKFELGDLEERKYWDDYQVAYTDAICETATEKNPWYIVPADNKTFTRAVVSEVLLEVMKTIDPQYPTISEQQRDELLECKKLLEEEAE